MRDASETKTYVLEEPTIRVGSVVKDSQECPIPTTKRNSGEGVAGRGAAPQTNDSAAVHCGIQGGAGAPADILHIYYIVT